MKDNNEILQSNKCGPFEVLSKDKGMCTIYFIDTGTIIEVPGHSVHTRSVVDPYAKTIAGIGCIGEGPYSSRLVDETGVKRKSPAYTLWTNMIQRCYVDPANGKRPTYQECTVHPDWHNFQTFCEDLKHLDGYGMWASYHAGMGGEKIELDKDVLCEGLTLKEYGPNTCMFMTKSDNLRAMWAARRAGK